MSVSETWDLELVETRFLLGLDGPVPAESLCTMEESMRRSPVARNQLAAVALLLEVGVDDVEFKESSQITILM